PEPLSLRLFSRGLQDEFDGFLKEISHAVSLRFSPAAGAGPPRRARRCQSGDDSDHRRDCPADSDLHHQVRLASDQKLFLHRHDQPRTAERQGHERTIRLRRQRAGYRRTCERKPDGMDITLSTVLLVVLTATAAVTDVVYHKIYNWTT